MPASRATPKTSPFLASPAIASASVSGAITIRPRARARRFVSALSETATTTDAASNWLAANRSLTELLALLESSARFAAASVNLENFVGTSMDVQYQAIFATPGDSQITAAASANQITATADVHYVQLEGT